MISSPTCSMMSDTIPMIPHILPIIPHILPIIPHILPMIPHMLPIMSHHPLMGLHIFTKISHSPPMISYTLIKVSTDATKNQRHHMQTLMTPYADNNAVTNPPNDVKCTSTDV